MIELEDYYHSPGTPREFELYTNLLSFSDGKLYTLDDEEEIYLTEDAAYHLNPLEKGQYGYEYGLGTITNDAMIIRPYSTQGQEKLEFTNYIKTIEISGQNLLARLQPELNWELNNPTFSQLNLSTQDLNTLKALKKLKFPQGSLCLQQQAYANNQAYVYLYDSDASNEKYFHAYANQYGQNTNISELNYADSTSYLVTPTDSSSLWGYSKYQNQYYYAEYFKQGVEYSFADELTQQRQQLQQSNLNAAEKTARLALIDQIAEGCDYYNPTAARYILEHVKF